jgi:hypothetical protein
MISTFCTNGHRVGLREKQSLRDDICSLSDAQVVLSGDLDLQEKLACRVTAIGFCEPISWVLERSEREKIIQTIGFDAYHFVIKHKAVFTRHTQRKLCGGNLADDLRSMASLARAAVQRVLRPHVVSSEVDVTLQDELAFVLANSIEVKV